MPPPPLPPFLPIIILPATLHLNHTVLYHSQQVQVNHCWNCFKGKSLVTLVETMQGLEATNTNLTLIKVLLAWSYFELTQSSAKGQTNKRFDHACPLGKWPMKSACPTGNWFSPRLSDTVLVKPWTIMCSSRNYHGRISLQDAPPPIEIHCLKVFPLLGGMDCFWNYPITWYQSGEWEWYWIEWYLQVSKLGTSVCLTTTEPQYICHSCPPQPADGPGNGLGVWQINEEK